VTKALARRVFSAALASALGAARAAGVDIIDAPIGGAEDLPASLRGAAAEADAVWLAPDPDLVVPETFRAVREFARARGIPFFAPTPGLAPGGVRGDLAASFRDCGRAAGRAAAELASGRAPSAAVYPVGDETVSVGASTAAVVSSTAPARR